jgi:integrase
MPIQPRPRYRADRDTWIVQIRGKQHTLARGKANRAEADLAFHRLMAAGAPAAQALAEHLTVADLIDRYLADARARGRTAKSQESMLAALRRRWGSLRAVDLRPFHVAQVVAERSGPDFGKHGGRAPWVRSSSWTFRGLVKRVFAWAVAEGMLGTNPLATLKVGTAQRRQATLSPDQARAAIAAAEPPYRDYLAVILETGARPGEIARLRGADIDWETGIAVLAEHKTAEETGEPRVIVLSATALAICRTRYEGLSKAQQRGPLFLNAESRPWTANTAGARFRVIQRKLGLKKGTGGYSMRHVFVDDCFESGLASKTVATLVGHTNTQMIDRHYSRLHQRRKFLRDELGKVRPDGGTRPAQDDHQSYDS